VVNIATTGLYTTKEIILYRIMDQFNKFNNNKINNKLINLIKIKNNGLNKITLILKCQTG
jgi:hypothetical protein